MGRLSFGGARHLAVRTGIGARWNEVARLQGLSKNEAINSLLNASAQRPPPPPSITGWNKLDQLNKSGYQGQKSARAIARREGIALKLWWIKHMLKTSTPLTERMTLFWHNHFTSAINKVWQPQLLHQQNLTLRKHALGNFRDLLSAMLRDPAMLVYLDGMMNKKGKINENMAREFLELYTLGQGHFTEHDVKAAAHGFTGWGVNRFNASAVYKDTEHSRARRRFLGRKGKFSSEDIINITLQQPRTAEFIAEKFWKEFVSIQAPERPVIKRWAVHFRKADYDIKALLKQVLNSKEFWDLNNRGQRIKSPIELIVGTSRMLGYFALSDIEMVNTFRNLGQSLFDPPNVAGWKGGKNWINTESILVRNAYLQKFRHGRNRYHMGKVIPDVSDEALVQWVLPVKPVVMPAKSEDKVKFVTELMLDPSYQLT